MLPLIAMRMIKVYFSSVFTCVKDLDRNIRKYIEFLQEIEHLVRLAFYRNIGFGPLQAIYFTIFKAPFIRNYIINRALYQGFQIQI